MSIYFIILFILFIVSIFEIFSKKKISKKILITLVFILIAFNRGNYDYLNYQNIFIGEYLEQDRIEYGYIVLTKIIKLFKGNHNIIILITAFIFIKSIFFNNKEYKIGFIIFLYSLYNIFYDINQLRNLLMYSLIYLGIDRIINQKKGYFIFGFLGASIHKFGLYYLLFKWKVKMTIKKYLKSIFLISLILLLSILILKFLSILCFPKLEKYLKTYRLTIFSIVYFIQIAIDFIVFKLLNIFNEKLSFKNEIYLKFYLFSIVLLPLSLLNLELIGRSYRNAYFAKMFCIVNILDEKKLLIKTAIFLLLIINAILPLLVAYITSPDFILGLITQHANLSFKF